MNAIHFDTKALIALPIWVQQEHPAIKRIQIGTVAAAYALVWYELRELTGKPRRSALTGTTPELD